MTTTTGFILLALTLAAPGTPARSRTAAKPATAPAATPTASFKLKPGAAGAVCLDCHGDFEDKLKKAYVHTPVRSKECVSCHNPHASEHGKLLAAKPEAICATCHPGIVPSAPKSTHKPVAENRCVECHDPHSSANKFNLVRGGNDLCGGCHKQIVETAAKAKFPHRPVQQGCTACHQPHGSANAPALLKDAVPGLCTGCHKTDKPIFAKQHMGYPVGTARCTSCHDPHGTDTRGMLYAVVHPPVAKGMCSMCHEPPTSKTPFKTKQAGVELCRSCHSQKLTAFFERSRVHQPVAAGACLTCHGPHASPKRGLVKGNMVTVCGQCHGDTIKRQELSPTKHDPIRDGNCTACHDPHSSDVQLMFVNANGVELCATCHDWQKHATHPIGATRKDPRNPNLTLACTSCHRAHGTEYKHMLPNVKTTDLCTKCHEKFKR